MRECRTKVFFNDPCQKTPVLWYEPKALWFILVDGVRGLLTLFLTITTLFHPIIPTFLSLSKQRINFCQPKQSFHGQSTLFLQFCELLLTQIDGVTFNLDDDVNGFSTNGIFFPSVKDIGSVFTVPCSLKHEETFEGWPSCSLANSVNIDS